MAHERYPGITIDAGTLHGRPVVKGTRVPVGVIVGALAGGSPFEEIMADYYLTAEQIRTALAYATHMLRSASTYAAS